MMVWVVALCALAFSASPSFAESGPHSAAQKAPPSRGQTAAATSSDPVRQPHAAPMAQGGGAARPIGEQSDRGHAHKNHPADFCGVWTDGEFHCH
jgi:hypothetical protein